MCVCEAINLIATSRKVKLKLRPENGKCRSICRKDLRHFLVGGVFQEKVNEKRKEMFTTK